MARLPWGLVALLMGLGWTTPVQATTWNRIAQFLQMIETTGVEAFPLLPMTAPLDYLGRFMTVDR